MKPFLIGIAGAYSGVGKTTVACRLLGALPSWGAVKYTHSPFVTSLVEEDKLVSRAGKDTQRLISAGATQVLWITSPRYKLKPLVNEALKRLSHCNGIIIEGNSAVRLIVPNLTIFVSDGNHIKKSAKDVLAMADIIAYNTLLPDYAPKDKLTVSMNDRYFVDKIIENISIIVNNDKDASTQE
jgi:molybdopterin-guanine dinucleotide biosynthesis protein